MLEPDGRIRPRRRVLAGVLAAAVVAALGAVTPAGADAVDCAQVKCVALTFDDGPSPHTDRLLNTLIGNDANATFFLIGNKVAADPAAARRIAGAGMEIGSHTFDHLDMTTIPPQDVAGQLSRADDVIRDATGTEPRLWRPAGGLTNDAVNDEAGKQGLATILWDVIPYDWINDTDTAATRDMLMSQVRPGSVVLLHDTFSSTVDLMEQFIPVLKANGYHLVTVSTLLGPRAPGSVYGGRDNGPPVGDLS